MTEPWRRLPAVAQDAVAAALFALCWFGGYWYLSHTDWNPRRPEVYLWLGAWTSAGLLLRRTAPLGWFVITVMLYPVVSPPPLQTEFQLLPILAAAYAATGSRLRSALVAVVAAAAVFVMTVFDPSVSSLRYLVISWDTLLVYEFVTACVVLLGALMYQQRHTAELLAARNEELERLRRVEAEQAIAQERTRIARELHDVAAHHLTALIVRAQATDRVARSDPEAAQETLRWVVETAREALTSMRHTVKVLRAEDEAQPLSPEPTLQDLSSIIERMRSTGLDVTLTVDPGLPPLDERRELTVVRITQEALTNALRHSRGSRATVSLVGRGGEVVLAVDDDGGGEYRPAASGGGHGLIGMRERAEACGGTLELGRSPIGGWRVRAVIPATEGRSQ